MTQQKSKCFRYKAQCFVSKWRGYGVSTVILWP